MTNVDGKRFAQWRLMKHMTNCREAYKVVAANRNWQPIYRNAATLPESQPNATSVSIHTVIEPVVSRPREMDKAKKAAQAAAKAANHPATAAAMNEAINTAKSGARHVAKYASAHPYVTGAVVAGTTIACAPALVTTPFLAVSGFGAGGVGFNTVAAAAHSTIGNVAGGSLFATLQSAGAGGAGAVAVNAAASAGGAAMAGVAVGGRLCRSFLKRAKL
ncbi:predicted protein [Chaetomium globosum CBS 148.51]|uniref:Uncharacterized protein n=1 Tax=Chaetomium globosum (strain ATCC 6205 / CBS 148.51 / DSM 1962 / NBRC 6347 / NRRL 1970) TaxID=306901 RepID=Q2H1S9_CHAGB|nr:uncharacterized protein CHGG_04267 [Chaetomium globosum CBS 148.51]EAQ87648.1 predicted protein [Chaetomium globosum CBS 148.51]